MPLAHCLPSSRRLSAFCRYTLYAFYIAIRWGRMHADAMFPVWDGWTYYLKAAWMADAPLQRILHGAFAHFPGRPPGPAWLTFPFLMLRMHYVVYALALMFWICVAIETAVCQTVPRRRPARRLALAVLLLFGVGTLFHGFELFYVDGFFCAIAAAAIGFCIAWLRRATLPRACWGGVALALALMTKPAAFALYAALAVALLLGWILKTRAWRRIRPAAPPRVWLGLVAWAAAPALALAAFWFTPYRGIAIGVNHDFTAPGLGRFLLVHPASWQAVAVYAREIAQTLGTPLAVLTALVLLAAAISALWRRRRADGPVLAALAATALLGAFFYLMPCRQIRFLAPFASVAMVALVVAMTAFTCRATARWTLLLLPLLAISFRLATISGVAPRAEWWGQPLPFSFPLHDVREDLHTLDKILLALPPEREPLVMAVDTSALLETIKMSSWVRDNGMTHAFPDLRIARPFRLVLPSWPTYPAEPLADFPLADVLLLRVVTGETLPAGSGSYDWDLTNRTLWQRGSLEDLGWREVVRRGWWAMFEPLQPQLDPETRARRVAFLESLGLTSESGRAAVQAARSALPSP